tara:strand:+ start:50468 stop:52330 length:1863 start_codon:yes stop_codon:yes gene_type:complete
MAKSMVLRGPDDQGVWTDANAGVALAHARLSVVEISEAGHQPMVSASGRYVLVYNGEAYNTEALREELGDTSIAWRGHSDTEVILECCARWGVRRTVMKLHGMFAFALWDRETRTTTLVRDRLGIKPLYWGLANGTLLFASELKALMTEPSWDREINRDALASYFRFGYVPTPLSIFKGIQKLDVGTILTWRHDEEPKAEQYWSLRDVALRGSRDLLAIGDGEATDQLDTLISDSVSRRMIADVPIGAFLSGGIDSSVVVAAMQEQSSKPVHTFTIGWKESQYDEAQHAAAIASHLGTDHTELHVSPADAQAVIPNLAQYYDEPFADSSQVPTFLVSQLARRDVTVALSGDGGDELLCGYNRYLWGEKIWNRTQHLPLGLRKLAAKSITGLAPRDWDRITQLIPKAVRPPLLGMKLHKVASVMAMDDQAALYRRLASLWPNPNELVLGASERTNVLWDPAMAADFPDFQTRMQVWDALTYLPDDILAKVDRASMSVSLEARVPLLDHRIAEFAFRLPRHQRVREGRGKWLLREVLARRVPRNMFERPKMGFSIPIAEWLRGPLRPWAEDLLSLENLGGGELLDPLPIRQAWREHLTGRASNEGQLWAVLMFQAWRRQWSI